MSEDIKGYENVNCE